MRVESRGGAAFRLTYGGTGSLADSAVGFDRQALDEALLEMAAGAGVRVHLGAQVSEVRLAAGLRGVVVAEAAPARVRRYEARIVVGADGLRSIVARAAGVERQAPLRDRTALSFHVPRPTGEVDDARMIVMDDGYVGVAPVPAGHLNVGIVLGGRWTGPLRRRGAAAIADEVLRHVGMDEARPLDRVAGTRPASAAVSRRAGDGWLLVGDAAGFLDPFTGEGLHRAIVSAELAAATIHDRLRGRGDGGLADYDRAMRRRFGTKDVVSRLVQAFLARPSLFEYAARRLEARSRVRETMGLVIGDLAPASRALDPRFLAALLAP